MSQVAPLRNGEHCCPSRDLVSEDVLIGGTLSRATRRLSRHQAHRLINARLEVYHTGEAIFAICRAGVAGGIPVVNLLIQLC
ncbi:hypothetical protein McanMca71_007351 [Microsporum canis]